MITVRHGFTPIILGKMDASATRRPATPRIHKAGSTTAPGSEHRRHEGHCQTGPGPARPGGGVAGGARAMRTAAAIPQPGQSSTAIVRRRPRGSHATVFRGRVPRRDWDGLLTGGGSSGSSGSSAQGGRRWGRSRRVRGVEQAQVREDRAHHGRVLHRGDAPQAAATARAGEDIEIEHAAHQGGPGPRARGAGGAGAGLAPGRMEGRGRAAVADDVRAPARMRGEHAGG